VTCYDNGLTTEKEKKKKKRKVTFVRGSQAKLSLLLW